MPDDLAKCFKMFAFEKSGFEYKHLSIITIVCFAFIFSYFSRNKSRFLALIFASLWETLLSCLVQVGGIAS